ncbi:MAG: hypothetical protein OXU74_10890 [Gemmatimonadota bacterium]|nr:hypothetical protein [Gemmatimonadota bacterium]
MSGTFGPGRITPITTISRDIRGGTVVLADGMKRGAGSLSREAMDA